MLLRTSGSRNTNVPAVEVFSRDRFETCATKVPVYPAHPHLPCPRSHTFLPVFLALPFCSLPLEQLTQINEQLKRGQGIGVAGVRERVAAPEGARACHHP